MLCGEARKVLDVGDALSADLKVCPLCGSRAPLCESHIVPRFVFEWLLETSATGHMRFGSAPNLRVQDGMKQHLLCGDCEQRLGAWEKKVAESLFLPYHRDPSVVVEYQNWLARFCASLTWRVLFVHKQRGLKNVSPIQAAAVEEALGVWQGFVLGRVPNPGSFELHLLPVDVLESARYPGLPPNINRYLARAVEIDVAASEKSAFVYAKMCKLIVLGFIQMPRSCKWRGSRVAIRRGVLRPGRFVAPANFGDYLVERAEHMSQLQRGMSARQRQKISDTLRANLDRAAESETVAVMSQDVAMFGELAFWNPADDGDEG